VRGHAEKLSLEPVEAFKFRRRLFQGSNIGGRASHTYDNPQGVAKWLDGEIEIMGLALKGYSSFGTSPDPALQDALLDAIRRTLLPADDFPHLSGRDSLVQPVAKTEGELIPATQLMVLIEHYDR
jgi:hypothetical protein